MSNTARHLYLPERATRLLFLRLPRSPQLETRLRQRLLQEHLDVILIKIDTMSTIASLPHKALYRQHHHGPPPTVALVYHHPHTTETSRFPRAQIWTILCLPRPERLGLHHRNIRLRELIQQDDIPIPGHSLVHHQKARLTPITLVEEMVDVNRQHDTTKTRAMMILCVK